MNTNSPYRASDNDGGPVNNTDGDRLSEQSPPPSRTPDNDPPVFDPNAVCDYHLHWHGQLTCDCGAR